MAKGISNKKQRIEVWISKKDASTIEKLFANDRESRKSAMERILEQKAERLRNSQKALAL